MYFKLSVIKNDYKKHPEWPDIFLLYSTVLYERWMDQARNLEQLERHVDSLLKGSVRVFFNESDPRGPPEKRVKGKQFCFRHNICKINNSAFY